MAAEKSVLSLVRELCEAVLANELYSEGSVDHVIRSLERPSKLAPWRERDYSRLLSELTWRAFDTLLLRKWQWYKERGCSGDEMSVECQCLSFTFILNQLGRRKDACWLGTAVRSVLNGCHLLTEGEAILKFLVSMAAPDTMYTPIMTSSCDDSGVFCYESYPPGLFESLPAVEKVEELQTALKLSTHLFECMPGSGFTSQLLPSNTSSKAPPPSSLYGGLVHSEVQDLNTRLDLPLIPSHQDDVTMMTLQACDITLTHVKEKQQCSDESTSIDTPLIAHLYLLKQSEEVPLLIREWEGWHHHKTYLSETGTGGVEAATQLMASRMASLASVDQQMELRGPGSKVKEIIKTIDNLPSSQELTTVSIDSVSRMFVECLQSLMISCRVQLGQCTENCSTDIQLQSSTARLLPLTQFAVNLLQNWNETSPQGLRLLDSLYSQCCVLQGTSSFTVFLSLLSQTCAPYFKFLEQWVFQGWLDPSEEFGLHSNQEALDRRDNKYWNEGYVVSTPHTLTPHFLTPHTHTIITAGKALNLLRLCKPNHPLCVGVFSPPKVFVALSSTQLNDIYTQCQEYRSKVIEHTKMSEQLRQAQALADEAIAHSKLVQARQEAREVMDTIRSAEEAYRLAAVERKQSLHQELKNQMEKAQTMKAEQAARQRQEDKRIIAFMTEHDHAASEREATLKEEARAELVGHYQKLFREAELKRMRAEWRVARLELINKRQRMMKEDGEMWDREMQGQQIEEGQGRRKTWLESGDGHREHHGRKTWLESLLESPSVIKREETTELITPDLTVHISTDQLTQVDRNEHTTAEQLDATDHATANQQAEVDPTEHRATDQPMLVDVTDHLTTDKLTSTDSIDHQTTVKQSSVEPLLTTIQLMTPAPSVIQEILYDRPTTDPHLLSRMERITLRSPSLKSTRGEATPTVVNEILYPRGIPSEPVEEEGLPRVVTTRGTAPPSIVQNIMYVHCEHGSDMIQDPLHPRLLSTRGRGPTDSAHKLMYPDIKETVDVTVATETERDEVIFDFGPSSQFQDHFEVFNTTPTGDLLETIVGPRVVSQDNDVESGFLSLYPLPALLENCIALPLSTQSSLINQALLDHFTHDCRIDRHFTALKRFILLEDGEFAHIISTRLCEQLTFSSWRDLYSASFLNPLLSTALESSLHGSSPETNRLSFAVSRMPTRVHTYAVDALKYLELKYTVDWPCNIVITSNCISKYTKIFQLLVQLKRVSWVLKNTFHRLRQCDGLNQLQARELQAYRHEFQHFVNIMSGYLANQLFYLTWKEFENELAQNVHSLDELIKAHQSFIEKAIFRCLLSKKAAPVMNVIHDVLSSILEFSVQVTVLSTQPRRTYRAMCHTHRKFRHATGVLITVVNKLVKRGYQPHLEDLLLRLNFNDYYGQIET